MSVMRRGSLTRRSLRSQKKFSALATESKKLPIKGEALSHILKTSVLLCTARVDTASQRQSDGIERQSSDLPRATAAIHSLKPLSLSAKVHNIRYLRLRGTTDTRGYGQCVQHLQPLEDLMGSYSDMNALGERLTCFLQKLQAECGILERMVYKNKNQHRRCSYFKYLLKVRRDLRLLQSMRLDEIVRFCFLVIVGDRPKQKVHLLESLKRRKSDSGKYNFLERLLGAARLLSQMVEPMLKTATEVSILFAQSFFMGFSLTIMALLARLRVLVQQILLDIVQLFNTVSSLSQEKQSIKINQEGIEVFREFYPIKEDFIILECVWKSDKFLLLEKMQTRKTTSNGDAQEKVAFCGSAVNYETVESFLADISEEVNAEFDTKVDPLNIMQETTSVLMRSLPSDSGKMSESCDLELTEGSLLATSESTPCSDTLKVHLSSHEVTSDSGSIVEKCSPGVIDETHSNELPGETGLTAVAKSSPGGKASRLSSSSKEVAFVSVKNPKIATSVKNLASSSRQNTFDLMKNTNSNDREDTFFNLLTGGIVKDSLF